MATSKKITALTAATTVTANNLLVTVEDPSGTPATKKVTVKTLLEANVTANLAVNGSFTFVGRGVANVFIINYSGTPANSTDVPAGFSTGAHWSDGSYVYWVTGPSSLVRVAVATW